MKEGKKNSKALLVGIIAAVLVLAGLLVLLLTQCVGGWGEGSAPTSAPATEPEKCDIYWNMDRSEYGGKSEAGMSSRKPEADGYWHIRFFLDGQEVTLKTETRQLVNTIDSMDVMGLTFDEEGMITGVTNIDEMPVERVGWQFYVQSVARTVIKLNSSNKFNGMEVMLEDVDPNRIWDMTGISGPKGRVAELIKYDKVMALADVDGNITHVFIYDRPNYMLSHEGTCMHCEETVVWNEWTKTDELPTDTGHYQLQNNVKVKSQVSPLEEAKICLDLNGCRVEGPNNSRLIIMNKPSIELAIMDTSEAQTGVIAPRGNGNMGMGIMVKHGALSLYSGTIDASKVVNTSGAAISVSKGRFFYMYGGKIIGGEAKCVQNPDTGAFESGAGGALYVSGKFVMHDGIIENGRATSIVSYKNGSRVYNRGLGGNIYLASGSEFEMNGGTIRGGQAGSYGGNIGSDGMTLITINGGTISGGKVTGDGRMGGNIYASSKVTCTINGGIVSGGTNSNLSIYSGDTLTVSGGSIEGGKASDGGNIKINSATLNLTGGTVTGGEATGGVGGNIYVGNGTAVITGGLIEKGTAKTAGGNVGTNNATSQITIGGDAVIQNGYANRGGNVAVHSEPNNGLTIEGNALITGGKAYTAGGNLSLYLGSAAKKSGTVVMTGGKIEKGEAPYGGNVNLKGKDADNTAAFVFAGGTIENGTSVNYGANIYTKNDFTALELSGSVNGGVYVTGGKITLKGAPVIDKTGTAYAYSILLPEGNAMDVKDLTGGKVYVTAQIGAVIATNAASEELTGYVLSEVTDEDDALVPVIWNEKDSTLLMGQIVETHCTCGADSENKYECHCADADKGALEWHAWESADSLPTTTGNYYLKGNVDLSAQTDAKPEADAVIRIDLMGHQILLENAENLYDFTDVTNVRLVITDSTEQPGAVVLTGTDTVTGGILKLTSANTFVLYRATMDVSGFAVGALDGGLAYINSGASFLMHSGNLVGRNDGRMLHVNGNAELYGGTVSGGLINIRTGNAGAKVKLSGVTVTNAVANATSIRMDHGELTIEEGTAIINTADGATNVATTDSNASRIVMTGGTISGGKNSNVRLKFNDSFTMSGGTVTGGSAANGGNFYLEGSTDAFATLTVTGGTIENGSTTASRTGANIRLNNGYTKLIVDGATIPGGIHANSSATITLKNNVTIDKGDSGLDYSLRMGDNARLIVGELTGGQILIYKDNSGKVIAENVETDLSGFFFCDKSNFKIDYNASAKTLVHNSK